MCTRYEVGDNGSKRAQNHALANQDPLMTHHPELTLLPMEQKHTLQTQLLRLRIGEKAGLNF